MSILEKKSLQAPLSMIKFYIELLSGSDDNSCHRIPGCHNPAEREEHMNQNVEIATRFTPHSPLLRGHKTSFHDVAFLSS